MPSGCPPSATRHHLSPCQRYDVGRAMRSARHLATWSRRFRRPWQRRLARVGLALLSVVALGWVGWAAAGVYVDWSWFGSLGYSDVYARQLSTRLILFLAGGAI